MKAELSPTEYSDTCQQRESVERAGSQVCITESVNQKGRLVPVR